MTKNLNRLKTFTLPKPTIRRRFRRRLLGWYKRNGRDLPWRQTQDPYRILVSEVMLQQTQVDRVIPKYNEWIKKFPTLQSLAKTTVDKAARAWYPLGYNVRPKRLHAIAREVVAVHNGKLPSDESTLRSFKGLGKYTVGAIRSFAFGQRTPIVDTNVARVLFRIFINKGDPKSHKIKQKLWILSATLLPRRNVFDFNQALMDFGALLCLPRQPKCQICTMKKICKAYPFKKMSLVRVQQKV